MSIGSITYKPLMMARTGVYIDGRKVGEIRLVPHVTIGNAYIYVPTGQAAGTCEPFRTLSGCKANLEAAP